MPGRTIPLMPRTDRRRLWLALMLMLSLLFTQWLGFGHAIAHVNGLPEFSSAAPKTNGLPEHQKSSGACASLDAATLGAGVPVAAFVPALAALADGPIQLPLRSGWHRLFTAHFNSRAPPLNA